MTASVRGFIGGTVTVHCENEQEARAHMGTLLDAGIAAEVDPNRQTVTVQFGDSNYKEDSTDLARAIDMLHLLTSLGNIA